MIEGDSMLSLRPSRVSDGPRGFNFFSSLGESDGIDQCSRRRRKGRLLNVCPLRARHHVLAQARTKRKT